MNPFAERPTFLVSGASGALGLAFVAAARRRWPQADIIALVRSQRSADAVRAGVPGGQVRFVFADLTDPGCVEAVIRQIGSPGPVIGIHAAADVSWDKSADDLAALNVAGTSRFYDMVAATGPAARFVYLSTAYTREQDWTYRNGYEETKARASAVLRAKAVRMPVSVFSCSLVVGDSRTGEIARYNGIYPMLRFIAEVRPPFIVGRREGLLNLIPLDWVTQELMALVAEQVAGCDPRDIVAVADGAHRISLEASVRIAEASINRFLVRNGLPAAEPTPILRSRQWDFLARSIKAWEPPGLRYADFRFFERLMEVYGTYAESHELRASSGTRTPCPDPHEFLPRVFDAWLARHADRLLQRYRKAAPASRPAAPAPVPVTAAAVLHA